MDLGRLINSVGRAHVIYPEVTPGVVLQMGAVWAAVVCDLCPGIPIRPLSRMESQHVSVEVPDHGAITNWAGHLRVGCSVGGHDGLVLRRVHNEKLVEIVWFFW